VRAPRTIYESLRGMLPNVTEMLTPLDKTDQHGDMANHVQCTKTEMSEIHVA